MERMMGLSSDEVADRVSRGQVNSGSRQETKTYGQIVFKNVFTGFNIILFVLGAILLLLDDPLSALAATGIILINIVIATIQECKAKMRLDKISLLLRPKVNVVRDGGMLVVDQSEIVMDDIIALTPGEQALVDGVLVDQSYLEMDESLLTGESDTVRKSVGETIYSGSYCIAGEGYFKVNAFGDDSFASKLMSSARKNINKKTPLQMETQTITFLLLGIALVFALLSSIGQWIIGHSFNDIIYTIVVITEIVPIALFLLIVLTYMLAAIRMADTGVLLQESGAVESMSHVDTVCMDKTGTITTNKLTFNKAYRLSDVDVDTAIREYIGSIGGKNRTIDALENEYGSVKCEAVCEIRFTSARKFSAAHLVTPEGERRFYLGAPSVLAPHTENPSEVFTFTKECSDRGLRTVFFAESAEEEDMETSETVPRLIPIALFAIEDEVRPDCRDTIDVFIRNGMDIKVISGDDPATVDALFTIAKIPGTRKVISGDELSAMSKEDFDKAALETNIFGRMKPEQKEQVIDSLRAQGRYVAMVGDGVNDVRSLKKAQVGVALESGSGAARGVADMVLIDDDFGALPKALVEGKRTVSGMRDILKVYISRNLTLAVILGLTLLVTQHAPFVPVQNTYYSLIATGISAFFLTIWAKPTDSKDLVLPAVLRYALPTALSIGIFGLIGYAGVWNLVEMGYISDFGMESQRVASAALVMFLALTGALQLLVVLPYGKVFSLDGKVAGDIKPVILCGLLVFLAIALYNLDYTLDLMDIPQLSYNMQACIIAYSLIWLVFQHIFVKTRHLDFINNKVEEHYHKVFEAQRLKENARELKGEEETWRL